MGRGVLFTVGYEGRQLDELIAMLAASKVSLVIARSGFAGPRSTPEGSAEVESTSASCRCRAAAAFSKTPLGTALGAAGIDYVHLRAAGTPYRREKDAISRPALLAKYARHIRAADDVVTLVADTARGRRAALLCYEADPQECHRCVLAPRVAARLGCAIRDL